MLSTLISLKDRLRLKLKVKTEISLCMAIMLYSSVPYTRTLRTRHGTFERKYSALWARRERSRERRATESDETREAKAGESVVLLKLLNTISMRPSN